MFSLRMERSRSDSSTSSASSALSLSPSGWTPRATLSPATTTTTTTPLGGSPELAALSKPLLYDRPTLVQPKRTLTAPGSVYETFCPSSGRGAFGYPCWPAGESLSAGSSPYSRSSGAMVPATPSSTAAPTSYECFQPPTSRISDDDLEQLDFSAVKNNEDEIADSSSGGSSSSQPLPPLDEMPVGAPLPAGCGISWSQVGGANAAPEPALQQQQQQQRRRRLPPPPPGMAMGEPRNRRKRMPSRSTSRGASTRRRISQAA